MKAAQEPSGHPCSFDPELEPESAESITTVSTNAASQVKDRNPDDRGLQKGQGLPGSWALAGRVLEMNERDLQSGLKRRELGVTWQDLTVEAPGVDSATKHNFASQFNLMHNLQSFRHKPAQKKILDNSHGCVKPGEMLLVLGRPGSGCTTLLKLLANRRDGYSVQGDVSFGSMNHEEAANYRGQIVMNTEEEIFFPTLKVGDTIDFATRMKIPSQSGDLTATEYRQGMEDFLLQSMGISHTVDTKVGNEYVRGVSGGERKRVSIIECLATRGSIFCWDNSTRGLDASSALEWAKALRCMTDTYGLATIVTLYQAGNGIYDLFDKVLVLDEGQQIFYGPMKNARPFFEHQGFVCREGANVADYLTGVTVPTEREIKSGFESSFPRTAIDIRSRYESSATYKNMVQEEDYPTTARARDCTSTFQEAIAVDQHNSLRDSVFTVSLYQQVMTCIIRQYQIIRNDKATFLIKQISALVQALVAGSLFYNAAPDTTGLFIKSGLYFLPFFTTGS